VYNPPSVRPHPGRHPEADMESTRIRNAALLVIALLLLAIAARPYLSPANVEAQALAHDFYIEPGTYNLRAPDGSRQQLGKIMIDRRTGEIWGFPTLTPDPYPSAASSSEPPVSEPFYLGKFDLAAAHR